MPQASFLFMDDGTQRSSYIPKITHLLVRAGSSWHENIQRLGWLSLYLISLRYMCSDLRLCSYLAHLSDFLYFSLPCPHVFAINLPAGVLGSARKATLVVSSTSHFVYSKGSTDPSGSLTADPTKKL